MDCEYTYMYMYVTIMMRKFYYFGTNSVQGQYKAQILIFDEKNNEMFCGMKKININ